MPLDVGRVTHLLEQMHRSEDDAGDPIAIDKVLVTDGARGFTWEDYGGGVFNLLGWFNVMDYGATGDGSTDDTAGIQAAIDACEDASGGTVYFPVGEYVVSGALQDTGARNGQLLIPTISTSNPQITMRFLGGGARPPFAPAGPVPDPGGYSIIRSTLTGASGTAACISGGNEVFTSKNNVSVVIENLLCMAPDNPTFTFWNISSCQGGAVRDLMITMTSWSSATKPTNSNSYGIKLPQRGQSNYTYVDGLCVYIFYTGVQIGELTVAKGLIHAGSDAAVELTEAPHPSQIIEMHQTGCRTGIRVAPGTSTYYNRTDVLLYDAERVDVDSGALLEIDYDLDDSTSRYKGTITWVASLFSGANDTNFYLNGGTGAVLHPVGDRRRWEAVTNGTDTFVWEGTDLVHEWKEY